MKRDETKPQSKEPVSPAGAEEITNYINALVFDSSKDGAWYNADQVDRALDMITAKVYDALNAASSSNSSFGELIKVRTEKAEVEKTVMEKDVALLAANSKLSEVERKIAEYEKEIANYKIMEQKVAKLIATLKAGKQNG